MWQPIAGDCSHLTDIDVDHNVPEGAITVQLFPYDDTPNPGGVYKVWMTPVEHFVGLTDLTGLSCTGPNGVPINGENWQPANVHGFIPAFSKTDNWKVRERGRPFDSPLVTIFKFHDKNFDGDFVPADGDEPIGGWQMDVTDTVNITTPHFTGADGFTDDILTAVAGVYTVVEETPAGTLQTVSELDGVQLS